jgi:hypothetical protein
MVKYFIILLLSLSTSWAADDKPEPYEALKAFQAYQKHARNPSVSGRYLSKIKKAVALSPAIMHGEDGKHAPILVFVIYSRTHFKAFHNSYGKVRQKVEELIASEDFEPHHYQLNDLHPNQARRSIWQLSGDGVAMRVEVTPNNAITIAFFSCEDFRSGLHAARHAIIPPRY